MYISTLTTKKKKKTTNNKQTNKQTRNTWNIKIFFFFGTNRENKKKNRLIKDKVQTENADMKILKWPQQFHNKFYVTSC